MTLTEKISPAVVLDFDIAHFLDLSQLFTLSGGKTTNPVTVKSDSLFEHLESFRIFKAEP